MAEEMGDVELEEAKRAVEEFKSKYEGSLKTVGDQGNQIGDLNKKIEELSSRVTERQPVIEEPKVEKTDGPSLEELKSGLSEDQKAKVDTKYKELAEKNPELYAQIASNPEVERQFILAGEEKIRPERESLFEQPVVRDENEVRSMMRKVFREETQETIPAGGSNAGTGGRSGNSNFGRPPQDVERHINVNASGGSALTALRRLAATEDRLPAS